MINVSRETIKDSVYSMFHVKQKIIFHLKQPIKAYNHIDKVLQKVV